MPKILVVEDDREFSNLIKDWLSAQGYLIESAHSGPDALHLLKLGSYDLVVLDVNLPGLSGLDVCRTYRQRGGSAPVIMLTVNKSIDDKEGGFDAGADDYLPKPFNFRELSARVKALLKRGQAPLSSNQLVAFGIVINLAEHSVSKDGVEINLMPKEFAILELLMKNAGQVFSADAILQRLWADETAATSETIRSYITKLRSKLDRPNQDSLIVTVHGVGYKFRREQ